VIHMKAKRLVLVVFLALLGVLLYYMYGGSTVPAGQHDLVRITPANFADLRQEFNATQDRVRVIAMLSPT